MLRALYTSATGMKAQELLIDNTANNLANVNTNGFKRSLVDFADLLYDTQRQPGADAASGQILPTGIQIGSGVRTVGTSKIFSPGVFEPTGNELDVAIEGDGFFKINLPDGQIRYTRDGAFHSDPTGQLVTGDGFVVDGGVTIPQDIVRSSISIAPDGTVSGLTNGSTTSSQLGQLVLVRFPNPAGLSSEGGNLYSETPASGTEDTQGVGSLRQGHLELSNVEVVSELISLITAQRAYEVNSRAVRAGDEMLSTATDIVR